MEEKYIVSLLSAALNDSEPKLPPDNIDWKKIYVISISNSIAGTIYPAIKKLPKEHLPDKQILMLFFRNEMIAGGMDSMQEYELKSVMDSFEEKRITYVPLKGWFMKELYPSSYMRTMCDIDILINKTDLTAASDILKKHDFIFQSHGANHDGYIKNDKVSVELHWDLFSEDTPYYEYFSDISGRFTDTDGSSYMKQLSKEDYYLHLIAHLAKHFDYSGTGIRSLADIWLYNKKYRGTLDVDYLILGLNKLGLSDFESTIYKVVTQLFSDEIWDNTTLAITEYVMASGTYGKMNTKVEAGVINKGGSKAAYVISRLFPKKSILEMQFPFLEKWPFLLPICWFIRLIRCIFFRNSNVFKEMTILKNVDNSNLNENIKIKKLCGLN